MVRQAELTTARPANILVVDEDPETGYLLGMVIADRGHQPTIAQSREEALARLEENSHDLAILDLSTPEMNSLELFDYILNMTSTPVIFLTGASIPEEMARVLAMKASDYLFKPFHPQELVLRMENLLDRAPLQVRKANRSDALWSSRPDRPSVSVIIPTLNEAKNLPLVLPYLPFDWIDEVILVDGRSTDGTVEVALQLLPFIQVVREAKPGKGAALRAGYENSTGEILIVIDADGSHDPREIPRYVKMLMEGADFVKGSRFAPGGGTTDMPRLRKFGNGAFVHMVNLLFGTSFTDLCYGFHAFWRYCLEGLDLSQADGFEIDTAIYLQALNHRLHLVEVPSFEGFRFHGYGKLRTFPDGFRVLRTIIAEWVDGWKSQQPNESTRLGFRGEPPRELPTAMDLGLLQPAKLEQKR